MGAYVGKEKFEEGWEEFCGLPGFFNGMPGLDASMVQAFTVNVVDQDGNPVNGFRWLVEEDTTNVVTPGTFSARTLGVNIHGTYAPVATKVDRARARQTSM